jgi:hypothetical protein
MKIALETLNKKMSMDKGSLHFPKQKIETATEYMDHTLLPWYFPAKMPPKIFTKFSFSGNMGMDTCVFDYRPDSELNYTKNNT